MIARLFDRRTTLLPKESGGEPWLASVIAVLCFLACLATAGALASDRAAHGWARALGAEATVQVRPRVGESGSTAAARAAETLAGLAGVEEAEALDRQAAENLLRPWLGEAMLADLPLPHLVAVRLDREQPASAVSLSRALARAGLDASVDDHSLWRAEVERSAGLITVLAGAAFLITAAGAAAAVIYATRAGMAAQAGVISVLSLNGASDATIAMLYQRRYGLLAAGAGAAGAAAAMASLAVLRFIGGSDGVSPALPVVWTDILILSACPLLAALTAVVAARLTALARLRGHD